MNSSVKGYGGQSTIQVKIHNPDGEVSSTLPFTGFDLGLLFAGAILLVCAGALLSKVRQYA